MNLKKSNMNSMGRSIRFSGIIILLAGMIMNFTSCSDQEKSLYATGEWDFPIPGGRVAYK
jgi:hypothetical protein